MNIKITPYDCIAEVVDEALSQSSVKGKTYSLGFVGDMGTVQAILGYVLEDTDYLIDRIDMDVCEDNIYQLTISSGGFIHVVPIKNGYGDYLIIDADIRYVGDEVPISYIGRLDACGEKYTVFGFDYDDSEDENLSDEEAEDLFNNADITVIQDKYSQLPESYQQLVDLMLDWHL